MRGRFGDFAEGFSLHGFQTHGVDILTGTVIVDVIKPMWIGKASLAHAQWSRPIVHVVDELLRVKLDTFVILSEIDASNLYLNVFVFTLDQSLIPRFFKV